MPGTIAMNHKARRKQARTLALVASAVTGFGASTAAAGGLLDARMRVVHDALAPRSAILGEVVRLAASQSASQATTYQFNIEGAPIKEVAAAIQRVTMAAVTVATDSIGAVYSPGVRGTFTLEEALRTALAGTNMTFSLTAANAAVIQLPALSESVRVTGEVAIESPKYSAPLRDIPQTIELIPRAAMEAQGVTTLSEALRNVPGITLQAGEGGGASSTAGDMFNMRGFNASNSIFVDNVRDDGVVSRDVFNLEQVEVFLGPTGSDVGRGTASGYVNMQTKTPHLPAATSGTLTFGTASQRRTTVDINQPLSRGDQQSWLSKSAVRLNVLWQNSGVPGRDEASNESKGVAPSIALGLGTDTRVIASAQILRQDNLPDYGIPGAAWEADTLAPTTVHAINPVDQSNYFGSPAYDYDNAKQDTYTARLEHTMSGAWMISNQTRYNTTEREAIISTVQNPAAFNQATENVTVVRQGNRRENEIMSNQTAVIGRLTTGAIEHRISSGFEFSREQQVTPVLTGFGTRVPNLVSIYSPNPSDPVTDFAPRRTGAYSDGKTDTIAGYFFDSVNVNSRVQVNGGLRVERYDTTFRSVDAANAVTADLSGKDTLVSGKLGVLVRATANGNVYVAYGTTMTPPGGSNFTLSSAVGNQNNPNVDPQKSSNVEIGTKWDVLGGRVLLNAAAFHTINENVVFIVDNTTIPPIYNQDDKQRVDGITVGASGQITGAWQVLASFAYLDTENQSQNVANAGRQLQLTPKFSGSLWTTYRLPKRFTVGGGYRGTGLSYVNAANTIVMPGAHLFDALVEYGLNRNFTLRLNVNNLTDVAYIRSVNNNGGRYNPGYSRTAQLSTVFVF
jgi:catecholate siderophore receptor